MYAHGIGTLLNAGADAGESLRLLVDFHRDPALAQRCRDGEAADPGADDRDGARASSHGR